MRSGQLIREFGGFKYGVMSLAFSRDGGLIAGGSSAIRVFETASGRLVHQLAVSKDYLQHSLKFSPDGTRLLSGGGGGLIRLWDLSRGQVVQTYKSHRISVQSVDFSPNGHLIVSGGLDRRVHLWKRKSGQKIRTHNFHNEHLQSIVLSPDERYLAAAGDGRVIRIWDLQKGRLHQRLRGHIAHRPHAFAHFSACRRPR